MNTWLTPVLIGVAPLDPHFTGDALLSDSKILPAAPNTRSCILLASGALAPTGSEILNCLRCTDTAYPGRTVAAGPPDHRRTKQVGMHQAVCGRAARL